MEWLHPLKLSRLGIVVKIANEVSKSTGTDIMIESFRKMMCQIVLVEGKWMHILAYYTHVYMTADTAEGT